MKSLFILLLALGFLTTGCRDAAPKSEVTQAEEERDEDMIGLSLSKAEKLAVKRGLLYRVMMLDGKHQPATRDLRRNRVNFAVVKGKVVGVSRG